MPRKPRLVVSGYPHHVVLRGNNRSDIFFADKDKRFFLECLKEAKEKTKSKIYAYCLMTNHVHLLIESSTKVGLGKLMQSLGRKYVQYINKKYKRTGTLWEGRFKSSLVEKDEYLLACSRYIELNPVRVRLVMHPKDYFWSSFGFKGEGRKDNLLDEDPFYKSLGKRLEERQANYREYFERTISEKEIDLIRTATQRGGVIGTKEFLKKITGVVGRSLVLRPRGRPKKSL